MDVVWFLRKVFSSVKIAPDSFSPSLECMGETSQRVMEAQGATIHDYM
jgi:hypothetical protein